jgi:DNA-binding response OmpR family regulator
VYQAKSYLEAMNLAKSNKFDILLLEAKVGGHLGQMILESLRRNDLLLDTPVILIADLRDASIETVAEEIDAFHVHDKRAHYEDILPALYSLL